MANKKNYLMATEMTKEQRQEIINNFFYYASLANAEAQKLEAENKPKRKKKYEAEIASVLTNRKKVMFKK